MKASRRTASKDADSGARPFLSHETETFTGYACGTCTAAQMRCGCWDVDESDDVRAAY
jgi:hypothetical protein